MAAYAKTVSIPARRAGGLLARQRRAGAAFITPAILFFVLFAFVPILAALAISFTDYDLLSSPRFVGLKQYEALLADSRFRIVFINTLVFAIGSLLPTVVISLALALAFARDFHGRNLLRTLYFIPVVISGVVVSIVWRALYNPLGPINAFIGGLAGAAPSWLTDPILAPIALIGTNVWQSYGLFMLVFIAGLQAIPQEYYDAARVDGAGAWRSFRHVTVPLLMPTVLFVSVISLVGSVQSFTYQYVMTRGGPSDTTNVIALYTFQNAFQFQKMGYAAAMSVVLFVTIAVLTLIQFRVLRVESHLD